MAEELIRAACEAANCKYPDMEAMANFKREVTPSVVIGLIDGLRHAKGMAAINDARANGAAETIQHLRAENAALRAQLPIQRGEAVEVVAYIDGGGAIYTARLLEIMSAEPYGCEPLMTVAQHQRILAASVGSAEPVAWREHSVNYAKGEKCPETIETLQAAWDRDQELINDMRQEIARHKTRINRLEQRRPADQVADGVVVSRELLEQIAVELEHDNDRYLLGRELRALLAKSEGVK